MHAKTGIASRRLKPTLGLLDPDNTRTMPPQVAASSGLDILSHAIESFTAMPFTERPRPDRPAVRPAYQGSNPISDIWSLQALRMVAQYIVRAVEDPADDEARANMLLAASYAGVGFGNAGVHLPHGMSYPGVGPREELPRARLRDRSSARSARLLGDPECAGGVPLHGAARIPSATCRPPKRWARTSAARSGGCRKDPGRSHHLVHAAAEHAERPARDRLLLRRHSGARRRNAAAASRDQAFAAARRTRGSGEVVRRSNGRLVNARLVDEITAATGADAVLRDANELLPFESDGLARLRARPGWWCLPSTAARGAGRRARVSPAWRAVCGARSRHRAVRRRAADPERRADRV